MAARGSRSDRHTLRDIAQRYDAGLTIRQLAAEFGWSYGLTHDRLHRAKVAGLVTVRARGYRVNGR